MDAQKILDQARSWIVGRLEERESVSILQIGTFSTRVEPEYLWNKQEDRELKTYLMPPRVQLVFTADDFLLDGRKYADFGSGVNDVLVPADMVLGVSGLLEIPEDVVKVTLRQYLLEVFNNIFTGRRQEVFGLCDIFITEEKEGILLLNMDPFDDLLETLNYPFSSYSPVLLQRGVNFPELVESQEKYTKQVQQSLIFSSKLEQGEEITLNIQTPITPNEHAHASLMPEDTLDEGELSPNVQDNQSSEIDDRSEIVAEEVGQENFSPTSPRDTDNDTNTENIDEETLHTNVPVEGVVLDQESDRSGQSYSDDVDEELIFNDDLVPNSENDNSSSDENNDIIVFNDTLDDDSDDSDDDIIIFGLDDSEEFNLSSDKDKKVESEDLIPKNTDDEVEQEIANEVDTSSEEVPTENNVQGKQTQPIESEPKIVIPNTQKDESQLIEPVQSVPESPLSDDEETKPKRNYRQFILIVLLAHLIAGGLYWYFTKSRTQKPEATTNTVNVDSLNIAKQREVQIADSIRLANAPLDEVTLESGLTLAKLAKKYYNNSRYWVYIYMQNKELLPDPNNVPLGTKLVIPSLNKYDLLPDSLAALKEAKQWEYLIQTGKYTSFEAQKESIRSSLNQ